MLNANSQRCVPGSGLAKKCSWQSKVSNSGLSPAAVAGQAEEDRRWLAVPGNAGCQRRALDNIEGCTKLIQNQADPGSGRAGQAAAGPRQARRAPVMYQRPWKDDKSKVLSSEQSGGTGNSPAGDGRPVCVELGAHEHYRRQGMPPVHAIRGLFPPATPTPP